MTDWKNKDVCKRGHDLSDSANVYTRPTGQRQCRACHRVVHANWCKKTGKHLKEPFKAMQRLRRYGLSQEEHDRMFQEQDGKCAICKDGPAEHVDHDHATNKVRQLLCKTCNLGIGYFKDRPELARAAAEYLERHNA